MTTWHEPDAVTQRRRMHERELERVGISTERGQALLDKWWREELERRRRSGEKVETTVDTQGGTTRD